MSDEQLIDQVVHWRTEAMTRWSSAVANTVTADDLRLELKSCRESYAGLAKDRDSLREQVADLHRRVDDLLGSTSWRVTRPLRFITGLFG